MAREKQGNPSGTDQQTAHPLESLKEFGESHSRQFLGAEPYDFRTLAHHYETVHTHFLSTGRDHLGVWHVGSESEKSLKWFASVKLTIKRFTREEPELGTISDHTLKRLRGSFENRNEFYRAFQQHDALPFAYALAYAYLVEKDGEHSNEAKKYAEEVVNYENVDYNAFVKLGDEILAVLEGRRSSKDAVARRTP